jgi:hypothetical protein
MQKSNTNQIIQGKATFKKDVNKKLIESEEIRAELKKSIWQIGNELIIVVKKKYQA